MTGRTRSRRPVWAVVATALTIAFAIGACGDGDQASASPSGPVVVTFEVVDERFKALLTDPADIEVARRLLAGEDMPCGSATDEFCNIPNGRVLRETGVNEGYNWSLDPNDFEFAAVTIEVCDGLPSDVETNVISGDRYCPWSAVVIGVEPPG